MDKSFKKIKEKLYTEKNASKMIIKYVDNKFKYYIKYDIHAFYIKFEKIYKNYLLDINDENFKKKSLFC